MDHSKSPTTTCTPSTTVNSVLSSASNLVPSSAALEFMSHHFSSTTPQSLQSPTLNTTTVQQQSQQQQESGLSAQYLVNNTSALMAVAALASALISPQSSGSPGNNTSTTTTTASSDSAFNLSALFNNTNLNSSSKLNVASMLQNLNYTLPGFNNNVTKQIIKLKRFLSTILSFGKDIDQTTGDLVKNIVFSLLCNRITIEQFQSQLQQATHFPLKTFVTPFLRATLPLLQQELLLCSQLLQQTPDQFLQQNKDYLCLAQQPQQYGNQEQSPPPATPSQQPPLTNQINTKMFKLHTNSACNNAAESNSSDNDQCETQNLLSSKSPSENGFNIEFSSFLSSKKLGILKNNLKRSLSVKTEIEKDLNHYSEQGPPPAKRNFPNPVALLPTKPSLVSISTQSSDDQSSISIHNSMPQLHQSNNNMNNLTNRISNSNLNSNLTDKLNKHWDQILSHFNTGIQNPRLSTRFNHFFSSDFEITTSIEDLLKSEEEWHKSRTKQIKAIQDNVSKYKEEVKFLEMFHGSNSADLSAMKRKSAKYYDEAVQEVQRITHLELRKTVRILQERALELVEQERLKYQSLLEDARRQSREEFNLLFYKQEEGLENCQNCGRRATEACSGCHVARYCGRFCQQRDWSRHKSECKSGQSELNLINNTSVDGICTSAFSTTSAMPNNNNEGGQIKSGVISELKNKQLKSNSNNNEEVASRNSTPFQLDPSKNQLSPYNDSNSLVTMTTAASKISSISFGQSSVDKLSSNHIPSDKSTHNQSYLKHDNNNNNNNNSSSIAIDESQGVNI